MQHKKEKNKEKKNPSESNFAEPTILVHFVKCRVLKHLKHTHGKQTMIAAENKSNTN